jgi:hypothetical protein
MNPDEIKDLMEWAVLPALFDSPEFCSELHSLALDSDRALDMKGSIRIMLDDHQREYSMFRFNGERIWAGLPVPISDYVHPSIVNDILEASLEDLPLNHPLCVDYRGYSDDE